MSLRKPTTELLKALRILMQTEKYVAQTLDAYIVMSCDAHNSEYPAECDKRRSFISGFTGSAGTAVITHHEACMWTDGRYYLQALEEMDSNWILMKEDNTATLSLGAWLSKNLPVGSCVGADPKFVTHSVWVPLQNQLESAGHKFTPVSTNLIDLLWTDKPNMPNNPLKPLSLDYTGKEIFEKLESIRQQMKDKGSSILVLTALDEIAWFLNLRGSDIEYNPVFFAYIMILPKFVWLFMDEEKYTPEIMKHLMNEAPYRTFQVHRYETIEERLKDQVNSAEGHIWLPNSANYALTSIVPSNILRVDISPLPIMKAIKNPVEIKGMRNAHIKDAAALCCYFEWLEKHVATGKVTEISGSKKLTEFRQLQTDFVGPSFETISSVGPHGAIIHYSPKESTDVPITTDFLYLCDSGGQYKDGTTDVTRTLHFGTPTLFEKECFTKVLKGQIKLATSIFPNKIKGNYLDSFARQFLWRVGLDYAHGTSHGIGSYLNVHEGPIGVSWRNIPDDPGLEAGMFISNEPGYYEDGKFGIRIEDIVQIVPASVPHNFHNRGFLTFETVTLVPIQMKMIIIEMLTEKEISHINSYHRRCRDIIGPVLEQQCQHDAKNWLWKETEPITA